MEFPKIGTLSSRILIIRTPNFRKLPHGGLGYFHQGCESRLIFSALTLV